MLLPHLENTFSEASLRSDAARKELLEQNEGISEEDLEEKSMEALDAKFDSSQEDLLNNIALPLLREKFVSKVEAEMKRRQKTGAEMDAVTEEVNKFVYECIFNFFEEFVQAREKRFADKDKTK